MAKKTPTVSSSSEADPVNPDHYDGRACLDAIRSSSTRQEYVGFLKGQVLKYNWRLGRKGIAVEDAGKAQWYQQELVDFLQKNPGYPDEA